MLRSSAVPKLAANPSALTDMGDAGASCHVRSSGISWGCAPVERTAAAISSGGRGGSSGLPAANILPITSDCCCGVSSENMAICSEVVAGKGFDAPG